MSRPEENQNIKWTRNGSGGAGVHSLEAVSRRDARGEELTPEHRQGGGAGGAGRRGSAIRERINWIGSEIRDGLP